MTSAKTQRTSDHGYVTFSKACVVSTEISWILDQNMSEFSIGSAFLLIINLEKREETIQKRKKGKDGNLCKEIR